MKSFRHLITYSLPVVLFISSFAWGSQWQGLTSDTETAPEISIQQSGSQVNMRIQLSGYFHDAIALNGESHSLISAPEMTPLLKAGAPDLPKLYRSVVIPDDQDMRLEIEVLAYEDIPVKNLLPSKGNLTRDINPASVPFVIGPEYGQDAFYPQSIAALGKPYVMREIRGSVVQIHPFRYNPVTQILRVYTDLRLTMTPAGPATQGLKHRPSTSLDRGFTALYKQHFINYEQNAALYDLPTEMCRMLIITADVYEDAVLPLITWKRIRGLDVELLRVSEVGNSASAILNTVQSYYDSPAGLTHLLLIGDAGDVAPATSDGAASDPSYALLDGGNGDQYPDIFVGRLSGNTIDHIATQVAKIISYESTPDPEADWYSKAIGLASAEGAGIGDDGESDIQHMNNIRTDLLGYGYEPVNQIYDPSANASMVTTAVNEGRGLINYVGHGSNTAWSTTGFSNSNVNALSNTGKLPVIFSVACVNGNFQTTTCFAESWLRAGSAEDQRGAVAFYGSTINQSWAPPMCAEDEFVDLLVEDTHFSIGASMFAASAQMIDEYGNDGFDMYATWHIFGDPSMPLRSRIPQEISGVSAPEVLILGASELQVSTPNLAHGTVALSKNGQLLDAGATSLLGTVSLTFEALDEIDTCLLTITGQNLIPWQREILIIAPDGPYLIGQGHSIDDGLEGNGNGQLDFGELVDLYVTIRNVGSETSEMVNARIFIEDPYLTILSDSVSANSLMADSTLLLGPFACFVETNAPDGYQVMADISLDNGLQTWETRFNLTLHAPELSLEEILVMDDHNGRLDRGEQANLALCLNNLGGSDLSNVTLELSTSDPFVEVLNGTVLGLELLSGSIDSCQVLISTQYATPAGHLVEFAWSLQGDNNYEVSGVFDLAVGLIIEDFESGDFDSFDWLMSGHQDWTIDPFNGFEGSYAARSGAIENNQNSELSLQIHMDEASSVSFFYRVSSQTGGDGLVFLVDGNQVNLWEGDIPWTSYSYDLAAGDHELIWRYKKNFSGSSGSDAAWLDFIQLPNMEIAGSIIGDVTADTQINVQDIVRMVGMILGQGATPTESELFCGDVNGDTVVDIGDLVLLVNFIMGDQMARSSGNSEALASHNGKQIQLHSAQPVHAIKLSYRGHFNATMDEAYHVASSSSGETSQLIAYVLDGSRALSELNLGEMDSDLEILDLQVAYRDGEVQDVTIQDLTIPQVFRVYPNYPNPFNPSTTLAFDLPASETVSIHIFDVQGRQVKTLMNGQQLAGHYELTWDGHTAEGIPLSAGLYLAHIQAGSHHDVLKMLLIK